MNLRFLAIAFCTLLTQSLISQQLINGTIQDTNKNPIPGVNIIIKNSLKGTVTDFDGNFSLQANKDAILVISYVGFVTQEITVTDNNYYLITFLEDLSQLDEVVVVGYGTQKKEVLTSSVSSLKGKDLAKEPLVNAIQALQGKAAGVQIVASDAPGRASTVVIRGLGTVQGGRDPLYVVDGLLTDNINNINSSDILTLSVLKDAASLAIYGNRGANGVIIVTTKKGKTGKLKVSLDSYTGVRDILSKVRVADGKSYVTYFNEAALRDFNNEKDASFIELPSQSIYNTNWLDEITRVGQVVNHNLSLSGGTENIRAFFSVGLYDEKGIIKGNDYNRLTLRSNVDYKLSDKLNFSHNVSVQLSNLDVKNDKLFTTAYKQTPIIPVRNQDGTFANASAYNNVGNPVAELLFQDERHKLNRIQASFNMNYKIIEPLTFTSRFSIELDNNRFIKFDNHLARVEAAGSAFSGDAENTLTIKNENNYRWFLDNYFTYDKTFNEDHHLKTTFGFVSEESRRSHNEAISNDLPIEKNLRYNINNGSNRNSNGEIEPFIRLYSYLARVNYEYKDTYLLNASYRRDGSSQFKEGDNFFGDFFAFSAGWIVSNENFMKGGIFDKLKLRASYGELGNQNVPLNVLTAGDLNESRYSFNGTVVEGITIDSTVVPLTWEVTTELNLGAEFAFFDRRLTGEVDYYERTNTNAILDVALPSPYGLQGFKDHVAEINNTGVEVLLNWSNQVNEKFKYNIGTNFTYNKNELSKILNPFFFKSIGGNLGNGQFTKRVDVGQPLGSFFLHEVEGIDDKGELVYKDLNNDGSIDENDKRYFGSFIPKISMGLNLGVNYNNFDLSVEAFANFGNKVYNGKKAQRYSGENTEAVAFNNRWIPERPSNFEPGAFNSIPLASNFFLESGDFVRVNNITVGYTIPSENLKFFSKLRIYASAKNPFIFKDFSGFNPELPGDDNGNPLGTSGVELDAFPNLRSFYLGINTSF